MLAAMLLISKYVQFMVYLFLQIFVPFDISVPEYDPVPINSVLFASNGTRTTFWETTVQPIGAWS